MKILSDKIAVNATLHCLTGCAIGEILGLVIGIALGLPTFVTVVLSVSLAFILGYSLSLLPLVSGGLTLAAAVPIALAADTFSISVMEAVDNMAMILIPGAMSQGIVNPIFWLALAVALTAAFFAALPVNTYLIKRGKGHALAHKHSK